MSKNLPNFGYGYKDLALQFGSGLVQAPLYGSIEKLIHVT